MTLLIVSSVTKLGFNPVVVIMSVSSEPDIQHHWVFVPPLSAISLTKVQKEADGSVMAKNFM
jgi:hypothetical protein